MGMIRDSTGWKNGLNASQIAYYENLSRPRAVCRGSFRHRFHLNELDLTGDSPGLEIIPLANGTCEVRDWCLRECGRYQSYLTDEGGGILWDTRDYGGERDYIATGMDLTRADDRAFLQHTQQQALSKAIGKRLRIAQRAALQSVS